MWGGGFGRSRRVAQRVTGRWPRPATTAGACLAGGDNSRCHPPRAAAPPPVANRAQTLALHLIEGVIDEVDGSVQVSWVQPRILTLPQVRARGARLIRPPASQLRGVALCSLSARAAVPSALANLALLARAPPPPPPPPQIEGLRTRLDGWVGKVGQAAITLEDEAVGVAQAMQV